MGAQSRWQTPSHRICLRSPLEVQGGLLWGGVHALALPAYPTFPDNQKMCLAESQCVPWGALWPVSVEAVSTRGSAQNQHHQLHLPLLQGTEGRPRTGRGQAHGDTVCERQPWVHLASQLLP